MSFTFTELISVLRSPLQELTQILYDILPKILQNIYKYINSIFILIEKQERDSGNGQEYVIGFRIMWKG